MLAFGGLGTRLGTFSSSSEVNQIFTLVEGNRRTHLVNERSVNKHEHKQIDKHTMPVIFDKKHSRSWQFERRVATTEKRAVNKNTILSVTSQEKALRIERYFEMSSRNEARMAHVHVDTSQTAIPADGDSVLTDQILEFSSLEFGNRFDLTHGGPDLFLDVVYASF